MSHGDGDTARTRGVALRRHIDDKDAGLTVTYQFRAEESGRVRVTDRLEGVEAEEFGFHPDHAPPSWSMEAGIVEFELPFDDDEERQVVFGLKTADPDELLAREPTIERVDNPSAEESRAGPERRLSFADLRRAVGSLLDGRSLPDVTGAGDVELGVTRGTASGATTETAPDTGAGSEDASEIAAYLQSIGERLDEIAARQDELAAEHEAISEHVNTVESRTTDRVEIKDRLSNVEPTLADAVERIEANDDRIDDLVDRVQSIDERVAGIEEAVTDLEAWRSEADQRQDSVAADTDDIEDRIDDVTATLNDLDERLADLERSVSDLAAFRSTLTQAANVARSPDSEG